MKGDNVLFPQGFDCHGLPTELKVENYLGRPQTPEEIRQFVQECRKWTTRCIKEMIQGFKSMGYSTDWKLSYQTMDPDYIKIVQLSLLKSFEDGSLYRAQSPTSFCTKCKTSISRAELTNIETPIDLHYITLEFSNKETAIIATTRPELLCSAVAVFYHPNDDRYKHLSDSKARIPLFGHEVPILTDSDVDPDFGSGLVFSATWGDQQDITWQKRYNLPVRCSIGLNGLMNEFTGFLKEKTVTEARKNTVDRLEKEGFLVDSKKTQHSVLIHSERSSCQSIIEYLDLPQWFLRLDRSKMESFLGDDLEWYPEKHKSRLRAWIEDLDSDWLISRQRFWGTPIPFWICDCGTIIAARGDDLPIDPKFSLSPQSCTNCGNSNPRGVKDCCDCWIDSSITPMIVTGMFNEKKDLQAFYPVTLRSQGTDIVRTWLFYSLTRCDELSGLLPFQKILLNSMILGSDGRMMSKSFGNQVEYNEMLQKYGADCLRLWAANCPIGKDVRFQQEHLKSWQRFLTKIWNIGRFTSLNLSVPLSTSPPRLPQRPSNQWILEQTFSTINKVESFYKQFLWSQALREIKILAWNSFASDFLESNKLLLTGKTSESLETQKTFSFVLFTLLQLLAPLAPFITEELYEKLYQKNQSIHLLMFPETDRNIRGK